MINFGSGKLIAVPTNLSDGSAIANPTPVVLGSIQDISIDMSVDIKSLYGSKRYPIAIGQGKGKIEIKAKYAEIDGGVLGSLFFGKAAVASIKAAVFDFATTIPTTPFQVTIAPPSSGVYVGDLGVFRTDTGTQLTRVASAPTTGQYSVVVATGIYTFAAADTGKAIAISYEYSATSTTGQVWTITNDTMGYTPSFTLLLQNSYDGKNMVCKLNRAVSGKLALPLKNDDFAVYDFNAEAFADSTGTIGYIALF
jgi:hypothetical protein